MSCKTCSRVFKDLIWPPESGSPDKICLTKERVSSSVTDNKPALKLFKLLEGSLLLD